MQLCKETHRNKPNDIIKVSSGTRNARDTYSLVLAPGVSHYFVGVPLLYYHMYVFRIIKPNFQSVTNKMLVG